MAYHVYRDSTESSERKAFEPETLVRMVAQLTTTLHDATTVISQAKTIRFFESGLYLWIIALLA